MEVTDDYFRMLQAVVINQVLQLKTHQRDESWLRIKDFSFSTLIIQQIMRRMSFTSEITSWQIEWKDWKCVCVCWGGGVFWKSFCEAETCLLLLFTGAAYNSWFRDLRFCKWIFTATFIWFYRNSTVIMLVILLLLNDALLLWVTFRFLCTICREWR